MNDNIPDEDPKDYNIPNKKFPDGTSLDNIPDSYPIDDNSLDNIQDNHPTDENISENKPIVSSM
jgi:hypothetical protein